MRHLFLVLAVLATASVQAAAQVPIRTLAVDRDPNGAGDVYLFIAEPTAGSGGVACIPDFGSRGLSCTNAAGSLAPVLWEFTTEIDGTVVAGFGAGGGDEVVISEDGDVAALAIVIDESGVGRSVVALRRGGAVSLVSMTGAPAPGGGTFAGDAAHLRMNAAGTFTFIDGGRLFIVREGIVSLALAPGDALPGGGTFEEIGATALWANGSQAQVHLDDDGNVFASGCTSDFFASDPPVGRCAAVRLDVNGDRQSLLATLDDPIGRTGYVVGAFPVAVGRDGSAALYVELYEEEVIGLVQELYRVDAAGTGYSDLTDGDDSDLLGLTHTGLLLDDGTFLNLEHLPDPLPEGDSRAIVLLDGATTVLVQYGDAAPGGGTFTQIDRFAASPEGDYALVARTSSMPDATALFMTRDGGALERVIAAGETLQVRAGDVRTVERLYLRESFGTGAGSAMGRDGSLAFWARFTDGSQGAFLAGVPPLEERPNLNTTVTLIEDESLRNARTTWRVVVENTGTRDAEDVVVSVAFDFDLREPSSPGFFSECTAVTDGPDLATVIGADCVVGTLGPGQTHQLELPTLPSAEGTATTTATPTQSTLDADTADDVGILEVDVGAARADLTISVSSDGYTGAGRITNRGPSAAEVMRVTGTSDAEITAVEAYGVGGSGVCTLRADGYGFSCLYTQFFEANAELVVAATILRADVQPGATLTMSVDGDDEDPLPANNEGSSEMVARPVGSTSTCEIGASDGGLGLIAGPVALLVAAFAMRRRTPRDGRARPC